MSRLTSQGDLGRPPLSPSPRPNIPVGLGLSGDLVLPLSGDLVERRVGYLVALNRGRALKHRRQVLEHLGIAVTGIGFRVLFPIPQTDGDGVLAVWIEERELVGEAGLFPKSRQDVLLDRPGEVISGIGLQVHRNLSCVHIQSPWRWWDGGVNCP